MYVVAAIICPTLTVYVDLPASYSFGIGDHGVRRFSGRFHATEPTYVATYSRWIRSRDHRL